jgi:hypothetical protein
MPKKKPPKREFALININKKCLILRGGKLIIINVVQPPRGEDFSTYRRSAGYDFALVEVEYNHRHVGEPVYDWPDDQKAVIRKTLAPPKL